MKRFFIVLAVLVGTVVLILGGLLGYRAAVRAALERETRITSLNGSDALKPITIDGIEQWLLIRGKDTRSPVLLWLHGGPGMPTMPYAHRFDGDELLAHFTVVHWDQRGVGKSYHPGISPDSLTQAHVLSDAQRVIEHLHQAFDVPVYVVGHSWGAYFAVMLAARHAEDIEAVIGVGLFVGEPGQEIAYRQVLERARAAGNHQAVEELEALEGPPWPSQEELATFVRWRDALGGSLRGLDEYRLALELLISPAYTLADIQGRFDGGLLWGDSPLLAERVDLFDSVTHLDVPLYVFQGRYDLATPGAAAERYLDIVAAPHKELIWFDDSAHFPMWEEPETFTQEMLRILQENP